MITKKDLGQETELTALIVDVQPKVYKDRAGADATMLALILAQAGGAEIHGVRWNATPLEVKTMVGGVVIASKVQVKEYNGALQVVVHEPCIVKAPDLSAYIKGQTKGTTKDDLEEIKRQLRDQMVDCPILRDFCLEIANSEQFAKSAAGKKWHHNYPGGLVEHTLDVMNVSYQILFNLCEAEQGDAIVDVVLAGAFLHDIGKMRELTPFPVQYTIEGRLKGHTVIGFEIVEAGLRGKIPDDFLDRIEHVILAHADTLGESPRVANTLEAMIVHLADLASSKINGIRLEMEKALEADPDATETAWVHPLERILVLPIRTKAAEPKAEEDELPF